MKKLKQFAASLLAVCLILSQTVWNGYAAEEFGVSYRTSSEVTEAGQKVTVTFFLEGYTDEAIPIRGIQADIENVDSSIVTVNEEECSSLVEDSGTLSNKVVYLPNKNLVRYLFVKLSGTMAAPQKDIFEVSFTVNSDVSKAGTLVLPVVVKIQRQAEGDAAQLVLRQEALISYKPMTEVTSVDINWGKMEYQYEKGTWNPATHQYEGQGWTDSSSGTVTVENTGKTDTTVSLEFIPALREISGHFENEQNQKTDSADLPVGQKTVFHLLLEGKPAEDLNKTKIGTVTVRIGGE